MAIEWQSDKKLFSVWISSDSWQLPGEERTVGSGGPFQIPKSLCRSSNKSVYFQSGPIQINSIVLATVTA